MASSSSDSSNSSTKPETSREMTPEFDSKAAYEACAPLHWDTEEWDFWAWSEDDESLTDGEDLQFHLDGELEDEDDDGDDVSWEGNDSSSEEEDDDESIEEDPTAGSFLRTRSSDKDDDRDDGGDSDDGADSNDGSTSDDGAGDYDSDSGSGDDDGDVGMVPPIKRRRFSSTYWW
jgi:hypothetical protein